VMQVNRTLWEKLARGSSEGFDLGTLTGNLDFSYWLYQRRVAEGKRGDIDWVAKSPSQVVDAPPDDSGKVIFTPREAWIIPMDPVVVYTSDGGKHELDKGPDRKKTLLGNSTTLRFQSRTSETVKVIVSK
jgi:hypothetical protein